LIPRLILGLAAWLCLQSARAAAPLLDPPPPAAPRLNAEEIAQIVRIDEISIPTPGELLAAVDKTGKLDWAARFRAPIATGFRSRAQMALNLGGLVADGYIAVQAQDAQQVKNIGRDIVALARPLGVHQDLINRGKSVTDFASESQWEPLREELEATQNEAKIALAENKDSKLIELVTIGGWLRGAEALATHVSLQYAPQTAALLRQPGIAHFLNEHLDALPEKLREDAVIRAIRPKLARVEQIVSFGAGQIPTQQDAAELSRLLVDALAEIGRRDVK